LALYDLESSVGGVGIGRTRGQTRGVLVAHGMESAKVMLGPVRFNFDVIRDGFAFRPIAKDHFVVGVFELEALQHGP
jgi:hypothetical protein